MGNSPRLCVDSGAACGRRPQVPAEVDASAAARAPHGSPRVRAGAGPVARGRPRCPSSGIVRGSLRGFAGAGDSRRRSRKGQSWLQGRISGQRGMMTCCLSRRRSSSSRPPWGRSPCGARPCAVDGPHEPAVLVHGLGGNSLNWVDLADGLADRLECVSLDLPGFGATEPLADGDFSIPGTRARWWRRSRRCSPGSRCTCSATRWVGRSRCRWPRGGRTWCARCA